MLGFDALESPPWRKQEGLSCDVKKTVEEMISDIMKFYKALPLLSPTSSNALNASADIN